MVFRLCTIKVWKSSNGSTIYSGFFSFMLLEHQKKWKYFVNLRGENAWKWIIGQVIFKRIYVYNLSQATFATRECFSTEQELISKFFKCHAFFVSIKPRYTCIYLSISTRTKNYSTAYTVNNCVSDFGFINAASFIRIINRIIFIGSIITRMIYHFQIWFFVHLLFYKHCLYVLDYGFLLKKK